MTRIIAPFILSVLLNSCKDDLQSIKTRIGINKNDERSKLHLVPVNEKFEMIEDKTYEKRRFIFINKAESNISSPEYLRKIIMVDSAGQTISHEEDYFKNPIENKYLILSHNFFLGQTLIDLQTQNGSTSLNEQQADSVLTAWKIQNNPFK